MQGIERSPGKVPGRAARGRAPAGRHTCTGRTTGAQPGCWPQLYTAQQHVSERSTAMLLHSTQHNNMLVRGAQPGCWLQLYTAQQHVSERSTARLLPTTKHSTATC